MTTAVSPNGAYGYSPRYAGFGPNGTNVWNGVDDSARRAGQGAAPGEAGDQLVATAAAIAGRPRRAARARGIALPAIGCGVMGWTPSRAWRLVLRAIGAHEPQSLERIDVALYDDAIFAAYVAAAAELRRWRRRRPTARETFASGAPPIFGLTYSKSLKTASAATRPARSAPLSEGVDAWSPQR